jgi:uncharacterized membrane protein HdeD (DUF308 family)
MAKNKVTLLQRELWGLGIASGVLAVLFGILALFWPGLTVALLLLFFGVFVLVWGIVGLIVSLASIGVNNLWWLELLFSLLAVGIAVYVLRNPEDAAKLFVIFIGLTFLVRGLIDLIAGLFDREQSSDTKVFRIIAGAIGVLAGGIVLLNPVSAGVAVVWVIGLYAVLYGSLAIAFAFRAQKLFEK